MNLEFVLAFLCGVVTTEAVLLAVVLFEQARSLRRFQEMEELKEAAVQRAGEPAFS